MAEPRASRRIAATAATTLAAGLIAACAAGPAAPTPPLSPDPAPAASTPLSDAALLDRVAWGATTSSLRQIRAQGTRSWLQYQLHPRDDAPLPPQITEQVSALSLHASPMPERVYALTQRQRDINALADEEQRKAARQAVQEDLNAAGRDAASALLLRALYSPNQLQEQMTWFWLNHFNVFQYKHDERLMLDDYTQTLRAHALGRFRDLLGAVVRHPAMLVYLDNAQNGVDHINENFARELMELHTLGVDAGYSQRDVQELARVLTGFGVDRQDPSLHPPPKFKSEWTGQYIRRGLFEFNPRRHDYGVKHLLGATIAGRGPAELDQVLDLLARSPATARHISRKLAMFFVADDPPDRLVQRMSERFLASDGDIAAVLGTLFDSPEFAASLGHRYKDPLHYVVSAVRAAYDDKPILNTRPMVNWLHRLGEAPYNRATPDGYPLDEASWAGPGQLTARFEVAKAIGAGAAGLFKTDEPQATERPAFPQLSNALYYEAIEARLAPPTRQALDQAMSPQEWNMLLLSSPEFMMR